MAGGIHPGGGFSAQPFSWVMGPLTDRLVVFITGDTADPEIVKQ